MSAKSMFLVAALLAGGCAVDDPSSIDADELDDRLDEDDEIVIRVERMIEGPLTPVTIEVVEDPEIDDKYTVTTDLLLLRGLHYHERFIGIDEVADGQISLGQVVHDHFMPAQEIAFHLYRRYAGGPWERVIYTSNVETAVGTYAHEASSFWGLIISPETRTLHDVGLLWWLGYKGYATDADTGMGAGQYQLEDLTDVSLEFGVVPVVDSRLFRDLDGTYEVELEIPELPGIGDNCDYTPEGYRCF